MAKAKGYDFGVVEKKWKTYWEKQGTYKFNPKKKGKIYSIDTPPPYISGRMHIGHAFSYAQQDFIARFRRMFLSGNGQVFYPFGTDDNGLPTERFIEKINKVKSKDMSRADFIALCLKTLKKITPDSIEDFKVLGVSSDYSVYYSTIDNHSRKISQEYFIDLYNKKRIYKDKIPMLWCPDCQTTIAQAELEDKELPSVFSDIIFKIGSKDLVIATTRPELLGACVAIFVHPDDSRYKGLIGKKAKIPLSNHEVPIIGDKTAEIEKGTGVMMVCSYGDKYDVDAIKRHKLVPRVIFNKDGTLNQGKYKGLKIIDARKAILKDLKEGGLLKNQKQITHIVNVHDKCGTPIEFLPTDQWFIRILDIKKKLIEQGKKVKWYPEYMYKRYENWVKGLSWDWSISRDRHFGIPMPVWYCEDCNEIILPKESELPVDPLKTKKICPKCKKPAQGETKVLDTWATSSLTPQIASALVKNKVVMPYSLRPQAHDIIRTWAFYTIVRSFLHEKKIPWNDIIVSGFVTLGREKMSKSKGNVADPIKAMEEFGGDALRFWAAGSKLGEDLAYQEKDLVAGKRFVNKLWNASKFVFMNLEGFDGKKPKKLEKLDEEFLNLLEMVVYSTTSRFENYEYSRAKFNVEDFFWRDFADNYIEIVKKRVYSGKGNKKLSAQYTLYKSLLTIIKLAAPIVPFITEEIYQTYFKKIEKDKSIHISEWPKANPKTLGKVSSFVSLKEVLSRIRTEKTKAKKSMNSEIILTLDKAEHLKLKEVLQDLIDVSGANIIKTGKFNVEFVEDNKK